VPSSLDNIPANISQTPFSVMDALKRTWMNIYSYKSNHCQICIAFYQGYSHIRPTTVVKNIGGGFNNIMYEKEEICHCPKQFSDVHFRIIDFKDQICHPFKSLYPQIPH
jgi:hypothetical protein